MLSNFTLADAKRISAAAQAEVIRNNSEMVIAALA